MTLYGMTDRRDVIPDGIVRDAPPSSIVPTARDMLTIGGADVVEVYEGSSLIGTLTLEDLR